jgi:adenosylmethionine---8-amino-7-oxononanoate aminotransferase
MSDTERLRQLDKRHLWHPFTEMTGWLRDLPLIIARAEGATLIDTDGVSYLDAVASLWTNVHGHCHPAIDQALREQLDRVAHSTLLGLSNVPSIEFAEALAPHLPGELSRIFYSDSGSTAVEIALKLAFCRQRYQGREQKNTFLRFDGAYHGDTIGSVSVGGIDTFHSLFRPLLFDAPAIPYPHCYRCPWSMDKADCEKACFDRVTELVEQHADRCAGLIVEPLVQGASGIRTAPEGFLSHLRTLCDKFEMLLIVDEVATGFGRTGTMFACEQENVVPDLLAMAKGISGGYLPLAATAMSEEVFESFQGKENDLRTFFHGHTYTGNPLACAAALASLRIFETEPVLENVARLVEAIKSRLAAIAEHPHVGDTRNAGLMVGIELVEDRATKKPFDPDLKIGAAVCRLARKNNVLLRPLGDVLVIMPPLSITVDQVDEIFFAMDRAIEKVLDD